MEKKEYKECKIEIIYIENSEIVLINSNPYAGEEEIDFGV